MGITSSAGRRRTAARRRASVRQANAPNKIQQAELQRSLRIDEAVKIINYNVLDDNSLERRLGLRNLNELKMILPISALSGDFTVGEEISDAGGNTGTILATDFVYTPAILTCGNDAQSAFATWAAVTNGSFRITLDGQAYNIDGIVFTGVASMAAVATKIQDALRAVTGKLETVTWSTNHFIITSSRTTKDSAITVLETSTGTVGTDISGAGAADWMDGNTGAGNGVVTDAAISTATRLFLSTDATEFSGTITGADSAATATAGTARRSFTNKDVFYVDVDELVGTSCDGTDTNVFVLNIQTGALRLKKTYANSTAKFNGVAFDKFFYGGNGSTNGGYYNTSTDADWVTDPNAPYSSLFAVYRAIANGAAHLLTNDVRYPGLVRWCEAWSNKATIPFTTWTGAASPPATDDPSERPFGEVKEVKKIVVDGTIFVVFGTEGAVAAKIDQVYNGTGLVQDCRIVKQLPDFKAVKGAAWTPYGIMAANTKGIFLLKFSGASSVEYEITDVMSEENIKNFTFDNIALAYDSGRNLYAFFGKNSALNNYGIKFNLDKKRLVEIEGWQLAGICIVESELYGIDHSTHAIYRLYDSYDDNGTDIRSLVRFQKYTQPDIAELFRLKEFRIFGINPLTTTVKIYLHKWNKNGTLILDALPSEWVGVSSTPPLGMGATPFGFPFSFPLDDYETDEIAFNRASLNNVIAYQPEFLTIGGLPHTIRSTHAVEIPSGRHARGTPIS